MFKELHLYLLHMIIRGQSSLYKSVLVQYKRIYIMNFREKSHRQYNSKPKTIKLTVYLMFISLRPRGAHSRNIP